MQWRALWTPEGAATIRAEVTGASVRVDAWGAGAGYVEGRAASWLGLDRPLPPIPDLHPDVSALAKRFPGIRMGRTLDLHGILVQTILQQKVTSPDAAAAKRGLALRFGHAPPGPAEVVPEGLRLLPSAKELAALPYYEMHPCRIERKRAEILRTVSKRIRRIHQLQEEPPEAVEVLAKLPGVGVWTIGLLRAALGDEDAVIVGDYHVPNVVAWLLAKEDRATDERMLELLEPYRPHRFRVLALIEAAHLHAPRYGPKMPRMPWR